MQTITKEYTTIDKDGNYKEVQGEFVKVSQIKKTKHQIAVYGEAVDWCQPNYYIVDGIVYKEETHWERGSLLVGSGEAVKTNKTVNEYFGENFKNYYSIKEGRK